MQANGTKLSAVARRRLLQHATSADDQAFQALSSTPELKADVVKADKHGNSIDGDEAIGKENTIATANQFSTLVENAVVNFSSSREVEALDSDAVKIRLSNGQKCAVLGLYSLWVKQGTVSVYGAILSASTTVYRVYAPATHALPVLKAISAYVELQLDPLRNGISLLPSIGIKDIWTASTTTYSMSSFQVLGHTLEEETTVSRRLKELDLAAWKSFLTDIWDPQLGPTRRILIVGRQSCGVSTLVRTTINRLLSNQSATAKNKSRRGVVLLDMRSNYPEFVPPGLMSLVHVRSPVFGPSGCNWLSSAQSRSGEIIRTQFVGNINRTDFAQPHLACMQNLFELERNHQKRYGQDPVVMALPSWLEGIEQMTTSRLWSMTAPTDVVFLDSSSAASSNELWRSFAEKEQCRVYQLPSQTFSNMLAAREHELQMQSYFHLADSTMNGPRWNEAALLAAPCRTATLSYHAVNSEIFAIVLLGGHIAVEDTFEALEGSLVALVAVETAGDQNPMDDELVANGNDNDDREYFGGKIVRTAEQLPRWQAHAGHEHSLPFRAEKSFCVGLALVQEVNVGAGNIKLITGPELDTHGGREQGYRIAVVIPQAASDGRFTTDWVQREVQMKKSISRAE